MSLISAVEFGYCLISLADIVVLWVYGLSLIS